MFGGDVVVTVVFDRWVPWSKAIGSDRRVGGAPGSLLGPNCFVGKDGSAPMMVPWELGSVSTQDTHH